jgi:hypothetical protein
MAALGILREPPIKEAVVDLRIPRLSAEDLPQTLSALKAKLHDRYPIVEERTAGEARFTVQNGRIVAGLNKSGFDGFFGRAGAADEGSRRLQIVGPPCATTGDCG